LAACFQSTSHSATTFSPAHPPMSDAPLPPAPMAATLSLSFGDFVVGTSCVQSL
jgi:hypothetical protein